jgi:bacillithiol system protein YtxJ
MTDAIPLEAKSLPSSCFVFKHSTTCPVSARAAAEVKEMSTDLPVYVVKVREQRELSNWVAETYGVRHESPQLILIRDGKARRTWNHWEIKRDDITE